MIPIEEFKDNQELEKIKVGQIKYTLSVLKVSKVR